MQSFTTYTPTEVIFGKSAEEKAGALVLKHGGSKVMIVYGGGSVVRSGLLDKIEASLKAAGVEFKTFGGAKPNPALSHAKEGIKLGLEFGADFILAVGGGSSIDTAKAIAHGISNPETDVWKFWIGEEKLTKSMPVGVVLTIAAAGSEMSNSAVLTNTDNNVKRGLATDFNRPVFAVMNPELTYTLPKYQITCGIVDIMMHTMDRYFTKLDGNEFTDEIAEALLRVVIKNGKIAIEDPANYDAMSELMWCSSISHNGLTGLGYVTDFSTHALGHELSGKFDAAHGASLSTMWGAWATYVYSEKPERFAQFAKKVWGVTEENPNSAALLGISKTVEFFKSIDMPTNFSELGIGIQSEEVLADLAIRCVYYGTRKVGNFRVLEKDDVYNIYKLANK